MSNYVLPIVGAAVGFYFGGPTGAMIGANLGFAANNAFFPKSQRVQLPTVTGPRVSDLRVQLSSYGNPIPKVYGTIRMAGNVIWATDIKEVRRETSTTQSSGGGKGGGGGSVSSSQTTISYEYSVSLAIAICEGEVDEITRVWADSKVLSEDLLNANQGKFNIHLGDEEQMPDSIIGNYLPAGTYSAYRGLCYIVIEDFPLAEFGNRIPNFNFEVRRTVKFTPSVEDKIKEIVLIPGAGEFVYSSDVTTKQDGMIFGSEFASSGPKQYINMHNYSHKADVTVALDNLQKILPNLEWVAVVVTWFATSTNAGTCTIIPKVEYQGTTQVLPNDWSVAGITRGSAQTVLVFDDDKPTYGGTPSDNTIVQLCEELQNRGLKVMLYPMPFVDTITPESKPWRGRIIPANATDCNNWFTKTNGYNAFIMHYANLTDGLIDAFVIGSELIGMTGFTNSPGSYPAVTQLVNLAASVKAILGSGVKLTYAADWSEYHSTNGWFNMDPLWSSSNIDFVGIDSYFPITPDLPQSQITEDKIKEYWEKGEGWDYYYSDSVARTGQTSYGGNAAYAWKNLEYWWGNTHTNPNASTTAWTSKMKPVWFTEFGFPSVDACANQPNVFYDPTSVESFFPRASKGRINFQAQREALNATLDFLQERNAESGKENLIPHSFLWTWDARPFPFWPDLNKVWADSILWPTGHWVNGKLGASTLGAIVRELLETVGLTSSDFDISRLTDSVEGYIIQQNITVREALEQLAAAYFFDCVESDGILKFVPRGGEPVTEIPQDDLIPTEKNGVQDILEMVYAQELELPQRVNITYIDRSLNYDPGTQASQRQTVKAVDQVGVNLPLVMNDQQAKQIADVTLYGTWKERVSYSLTLPPKYARVEPTDIITVTVSGVPHEIRVIKADMERTGLMRLSGVAEDVSTYDFYTPPGTGGGITVPPVPIPNTLMTLIDAPPLPTDTIINQALLRIAVVPDGLNWKGSAIYRSDDGGEEGGNNWNLLAGMDATATMGVSVNAIPTGPSEFWDNNTEITVLLTSGTLSSVNELAVLNGANAALIGDELIQFQNAELIDEKTYNLTKLLRGRQGTEWAVATHVAGDKFILFTASLYATSLPSNLIGRLLYYKGVSVGGTLATTAEQDFTHTGRNLKPFAPVHVKGVRDGSGNLTISWLRRTRTGGDWRDGVDIPLGEESEKYEVDVFSGTTLKRTIAVTSATASYSAADQVIDFGSAQSSISVKIYQLSVVVGRGYSANTSV